MQPKSEFGEHLATEGTDNLKTMYFNVSMLLFFSNSYPEDKTQTTSCNGVCYKMMHSITIKSLLQYDW